jgi:IS30 family transposase
LTNTEAPKCTDLRGHSADQLVAVAAELNTRPRKTLGWATPTQRLAQLQTKPPAPELARG